MLLEISTLTIRAGHEADFAQAMAQHGMPILRDVPGVISAHYGRGVENPGTFILQVAWDSMAAHAAFRDLPVYAEFGKLVAPYAMGGAMEHFDMA